MEKGWGESVEQNPKCWKSKKWWRVSRNQWELTQHKVKLRAGVCVPSRDKSIIQNLPSIKFSSLYISVTFIHRGLYQSVWELSVERTTQSVFLPSFFHLEFLLSCHGEIGLLAPPSLMWFLEEQARSWNLIFMLFFLLTVHFKTEALSSKRCVSRTVERCCWSVRVCNEGLIEFSRFVVYNLSPLKITKIIFPLN